MRSSGWTATMRSTRARRTGATRRSSTSRRDVLGQRPMDRICIGHRERRRWIGGGAGYRRERADADGIRLQWMTGGTSWHLAVRCAGLGLAHRPPSAGPQLRERSGWWVGPWVASARTLGARSHRTEVMPSTSQSAISIVYMTLLTPEPPFPVVSYTHLPHSTGRFLLPHLVTTQ